MSILKQLDSEVVNLVKEEEIAEEIERADAYMAKLEQPIWPSSNSSFRKIPQQTPQLQWQSGGRQLFKGELTTWTTFWDSYQVAIHNNQSLSGIEKFNYLCSLLHSPALDAIAGLTLTDANYTEATELFTQHSGNKQLIIDQYMEVLLYVEAVTSDFNLNALRRL